ncbi:MAG TPA: SDR family NAD(P)-dependent oxidoreductase [Roseiarcus sp.]|nr:SDR family NAD(P)-dependent oxidoreductase [Roseiarcus sp.]
MAQRVYVLTGATSGMGLRIARRLARRTGALMIAGARNPDKATALKAAAPAAQLVILPLDLARLASTAAFAAAVKQRLGAEGRLAGIICNAGLQILGPSRLTEDGVDESFATNHLGHFALVEALMDRLADGAVVVTTGSGTHNPDEKLAKMFGFRGADFPDAAFVALGKTSKAGDDKQLGMDRYATGKLCDILYAYDMASRAPEARVRFFCFDPGLMPGTGLARDRSAVERFAWRFVMPVLGWFLPGVSSPARSARAMVDKLLMSPSAYPSGSYVEYTGRLARLSALARRTDLAQDLHELSERIVESRMRLIAGGGPKV